MGLKRQKRDQQIKGRSTGITPDKEHKAIDQRRGTQPQDQVGIMTEDSTGTTASRDSRSTGERE